MLSEIISLYGSIISSYTISPLQETGELLMLCVGVSGFITLLKELMKL